jgi:CheY-like chemotaxis protein
VLVIAADPGVRDAVSGALGGEGYAVAAAAPGAGPLRLMDREHMDLLLLVMDPELARSGHWTVPAALKAHAAGTPILAIGAGGIVRRLAEELLAESYLDKPVLLADLLLAVARLCG